MAKYEVSISELIEYSVTIIAADEDDAIDQAQKLYTETLEDEEFFESVFTVQNYGADFDDDLTVTVREITDEEPPDRLL